jgi:hypothetical protein
MGKRTDEKSTEVSDKISELNRAMDEVGAKIRDLEFPKRRMSPRESELVAEVKRKFGELKKAKGVLGQKVAAMRDGDEPDRLRRYDRMLDIIERLLGGVRELDKLLDEQTALFGK